MILIHEKVVRVHQGQQKEKQEYSSVWLEHFTDNEKVTGSTPVIPTKNNACVAQLVEQCTCNAKVVGSNPTVGSKKIYGVY